MKEIKAVIQPFVVNQVLAALRRMPELPGVTVSEVKGFGKGRITGGPPDATGTELFGARKLKIEIVIPDELADKVTEVILRHAHTGNPGDGKIFVSTVDDVIRIRTGEHEARGL